MMQSEANLTKVARVNAFDQTVIAAVTGHMNGDHPEDNLLIARAFGRPGATASTMTGLDESAGVWRVVDAEGEHELSIAWPGGPIAERPQIRREVVALYKTACEKLGLAPREEHAAAPQTGHPHGEGHPHGAGHPHGHPGAAEEPSGFSGELRKATWKDHGDTEHSTFMEDVMRGRASREDYVNLVAQHYFLYEALEEAAELLAADERYEVFHPAALVRLTALEEDLLFLLGDDWRERIEPVPATEAYVARIRELAAEGWLPGIVAHHYTRYLGDLSGGQAISRMVSRHHGFEHAGVAFYDFAELGPIPHFKKLYREALDALGTELSEEERRRMVDEAREAYRFNGDTFRDLDLVREKTAA
jgi:heme oxygenase